MYIYKTLVLLVHCNNRANVPYTVQRNASFVARVEMSRNHLGRLLKTH